MSTRVTIPVALILLAVGTLCLLYAMASLYNAPPKTPPVPPVRTIMAEPETTPQTTEEATAEPATRSDLPVTAVSATTAQTAASAESPAATDPSTSAAPAVLDEKPAVDEVAASSAAALARRKNHLTTPEGKAEILWIMTVLPLLMAFLVLGLILIRRLRPSPLQRTGPSDMTDAWQEAGRRMK